MTPPTFTFTAPADALAALLNEINPVGTEPCPLAEAPGRVLAQALHADRPSPACDVSSMDGYAVRLADLAAGSLTVAGHARMGTAPPNMPTGAALHIVTGAPVPAGAEAVVRREDVVETPGHIELRISPKGIQPGANIRRQGENLQSGGPIVAPGKLITPPIAGALSMFGVAQPETFRRIRVAVLVTGDEVLAADANPTRWQLRDANGPALASMLSNAPWCDCVVTHVPDDAATLTTRIAEAIESTDALVLTGGVSMGDRDYVPDVLTECRCQTLFHKIPQRPGKPLLGAIASGGKPVLGLPGNPVSALVTARRYALPALATRAGLTAPPAPFLVTIESPDDRTLGLWWYRLVREERPGVVSIITTRGSGDLPAAAGSDGFVEIPPDSRADRPMPLYTWPG